MKKRILALLMTFSLAATLLPTVALAENVENEETPVAQSESITTYAALKEAIDTAEDGAAIAISGEISIDAPLVFKNTITLTGGGSIVPSASFNGGCLVALETAGKTLTLGNITLNAQQKSRVVYCNAGKIVVDGATITGGKAIGSYIGGVYMTNASEFEMNSGSITGNLNDDTYMDDKYVQYAADLWIGANANGALTAINGGTIGSIFVNSNAYSAKNPGCFTMNGGSVENLYVEYGNGYGASFTYNDGEIKHLYISTAEGNGQNKEVTPIAGVAYTGGQTGADVITPVAQVGNKTYASLAAAIAEAQDNSTVKLLDNVTLADTISVDKTLTLDLNGCKVSAELAGPHMICNTGNLTITDNSSAKSGEIAKIGSPSNYGYVIENHRTMLLKDCKISSTSEKSSAIENGFYTASDNTDGHDCKMTIQDSEIVSVNAAGGLYTVKNDDYGVMVINGGKFTNSVDVGGAVLNWNDLTINDGVFTGASAVRTLKYGEADYEIGTTKIINGTFNGELDTLDEYRDGISVSVTGGTFSADPTCYTAHGYGAVKIGDVYKVGKEYRISRKYSPDNATFVVMNKTTGTEVDWVEFNMSYNLNEVCEYTYTVSAPGYVTKTGAIEGIGQNGILEVNLERQSSSSSSGSHSSGSSGSSNSSGSNYTVSAPSTKNGDVTVNSKNAKKGDTVTITVTPDKGYELDTITVKDASGNKLKLTDKGNGKYTFTMPASKVTVSAEFVEEQAASTFADVPTDAYYAKAVEWAVKNGITNGKDNGLFGSNDPCTRGQIVTFLWRAAGSPAPKGTATVPADVLPGSYSYNAVAWALENGITNGLADGTFGVNNTCTRGQSVTFLYRTMGTAPSTVNGFTDVAADSFCAGAVAWAVENGVTNGTSATTFSPADGCTRAQIVTFLYRAYQGK